MTQCSLRHHSLLTGHQEKKRHGHNSNKRSNRSIMIRSNYYLRLCASQSPSPSSYFHLCMESEFYTLGIWAPEGTSFIQQTSTKHPCTSLSAGDPVWPKEMNSLPFWHVFKPKNGLECRFPAQCNRQLSKALWGGALPLISCEIVGRFLNLLESPCTHL